MNPQLFAQMSRPQQDKTISTVQARLDAKTKEVDALKVFADHAPAAVEWLLQLHQRDGLELSDPAFAALTKAAAKQYLSAKHSQALIELEELQLFLTALKSWQSPIVGAHFR